MKGEGLSTKTIQRQTRCFKKTKAQLDALTGLRDEDLAYGTDTQVLYRQNGDGAANWEGMTVLANQPKAKAETRNSAAADGDVAYTGYGFQPSALLISAFAHAGQQGIGVSEPSLAEISHYAYDGTYLMKSNHTHLVTASTGSYGAKAALKTYDADGFTLTWSKQGSPTETIYMHVIAFK